MVETRKSWDLSQIRTKTFYGAAGAALLILLHAAGIQLPYEQLFQLVFVWTGYSVADRWRK